MMWDDYYEKLFNGIELLKPEFREAIEAEVKFKEWTPGMPLPCFDRDVGLLIKGLTCKSLRLDGYEEKCILSCCSIGELIVDSMSIIESTASFVGSVWCSRGNFVEDLICKDVFCEEACAPTELSSFGKAGTTVTGTASPFFNVWASHEATLSPAFKNALTKMESHAGWDLGDKIPSPPKYVSSLTKVFNGLNKVSELNLSGWDVSNIRKFSYLFNGCTNLTRLNLSGWNTSNALLFDFMFSGCNSMTALDLSEWNTSYVHSLYQMFSGCSSLKSLDLSGWDTREVSDVIGMFAGCTSLRTLDLSGWDISNIGLVREMFFNCSDLVVTVDASQLSIFDALGYKPETVTFVTK